MKRFYFLSALLFVGGVANAQRVSDLPLAIKHNAPSKAARATSSTVNQLAAINRAPGDAIMNEDFANGLSGNTSFGAWTTTGADGALWLYDTDGPNGDFSNPATQIIQSASQANGFMIFDSNLSNPGGVGTARVGELVSPTMDLSGYTTVTLEFAHTYRHCCSNEMKYYVEFSDDGFSNNIMTVEVPDRSVVGVNDIFATDITKVDMTGVLGSMNSSALQFRFNHNGNQIDGNNSVTSHYYWQIDDVVVRESFDQDLRIYNNIFVSTPFQFSYYETPVGQISPVEFSSEYCSFGGATASGAGLSVDVNSGGFTGSSAGTSLSAGGCDSAVATTQFTPAALGNYDVTWTVSASGTEGDNTDNDLTDAFMVTDTIYARSSDAVDGGFDGFISNIANSNGGSFCIGTINYVMNADKLTSVGIGLSANSNTYTATGKFVFAAVYRWDSNGATYAYVNQTSDHEITANEAGTVVNLGFGTGNYEDVFADDDLLVVACHYGGAADGSDDVRIATAGSSEQGTVLGFDGGNALFNLIDPGTPVVKLNLNTNVGIEDELAANGLALLQNQPNPAVASTLIRYELAQAGNVVLEVFDMTGKKVAEVNEGSRSAGQHSIELSTADMSAGVYHYTLTSNGKRASKKMNIVK